MQGRKLKPWVKVALAFILGVVVVSNIFKITGSEASGHQIIHGVIALNVEGDVYFKQIDGSFKELEGDVALKYKKGYNPLEIVTVVVDDGKVTNDYLTYGKELDTVEKKYKLTIQEYRQNIVDMLYEK